MIIGTNQRLSTLFIDKYWAEWGKKAKSFGKKEDLGSWVKLKYEKNINQQSSYRLTDFLHYRQLVCAN